MKKKTELILALTVSTVLAIIIFAGLLHINNKLEKDTEFYVKEYLESEVEE